MALHNNEVCLLEVDDFNLYEEEATEHAFIGGENHSKSGGRTMEAEKRIRREIANSNERRRMQSINAGFQALRTLLPRHEGEKLSKAAILQQTAEYIYSLEQEKTRLLSQNCQLKRLLNQHEGGEVPLKKRKGDILSRLSALIPESQEESSRSPEPVVTVVPQAVAKKEVSEDVRAALERERRLRRALEQQLRGMRYVPAASDMAASEEAEPPAALPVAPPAAPSIPPPPPPPSLVATLPPSAPSTPAPATVAERPILDAVIKAEPRVEVELVQEAPSRLYLASTSRQNLETIVEAIRHLEGDHLFGEAGSDVPLALTKKPERPVPPLQRPGVIVVKHT